MSKNGRHLAIVAVLVAIGTVVTYYILTAVYTLPAAASSQAESIDTLFGFHFMAISFLFALIVVLILYSVVVFKRKPGDEEDAEHIHSNTLLEIAWTIIPLVVVIALGIWAAFILADITEAKDDEMAITVTGRQWSWAFAYPDYPDVPPATKLVLPVDKPIRLEMTTQDVLHSFWVPEFRVKQDLVPGQEKILRITPTETGIYAVRCAEICGYDHANMVAEVEVVSQVAFDQWIREQGTNIAALDPAERGQVWYTEFGCNACHTVDGSDSVGPTWKGIYGTEIGLADGSTVLVDDDYVAESILSPGAKIVEGFQPLMSTTFGEQFASREAELQAQGIEVDIVAELSAYIASLAE